MKDRGFPLPPRYEATSENAKNVCGDATQEAYHEMKRLIDSKKDLMEAWLRLRSLGIKDLWMEYTRLIIIYISGARRLLSPFTRYKLSFPWYTSLIGSFVLMRRKAEEQQKLIQRDELISSMISEYIVSHNGAPLCLINPRRCCVPSLISPNHLYEPSLDITSGTCSYYMTYAKSASSAVPAIRRYLDSLSLHVGRLSEIVHDGRCQR